MVFLIYLTSYQVTFFDSYHRPRVYESFVDTSEIDGRRELHLW